MTTPNPPSSLAGDTAGISGTAGVLAPGVTPSAVVDKVAGLVLRRGVGLTWLALLGMAATGGLVLTASILWLFYQGVGTWGVNEPVGWGFAISNYVFWVAIAMGGTFISSGLLLARQHWRTSINRFAETMTLLAALNAGLYPGLHIGSPWVFYYLFPYPNTFALWPQFRSPLIWDVFAIGLYLSVSAGLWYVGMVPDLAMLRDRATRPAVKRLFGVAALGWRGSASHWKRYQATYLLLAGLTLPVVFSVHSVTSSVFATSGLPWWNETVFPIYFVGGAVFSGVAMAALLAVILRRVYGLRAYVTDAHLNAAGKLILAGGLVVAYSYASELFMGWYGGDLYDRFQTRVYFRGSYAWTWWVAVVCNVAVPQLLWFPRVRRSGPLLALICADIVVGMWDERFMILVPVLQRGHLPSSWGWYMPTLIDWATFAGTIGFFAFAFLLFLRLLPIMSSSELMELSHATGDGRHAPTEFRPAHAE